MQDQTDTNGSSNRSLRDRFPIYCATCGERIHGAAYRIVGIRAGAGEKALVENVYQHQECAPEVRP